MKTPNGTSTRLALKRVIKTPTPQHPCAVCKLEVKDEDKAIECGCKTWFHTRCVNVTDKQYRAMMTDTHLFDWVCKKCTTRLSRSATGPNQDLIKEKGDEIDTTLQTNNGNKPEQLNTIIELLMSDISTLKNQLDLKKEENLKLSDIIARKMEVIQKLEETIHSLIQNSPSFPESTKNYETQPCQEISLIHNTVTENLQTEHNTKPEPIINENNQTKQNNAKNPSTPVTKYQALLIGDSTLRAAASIIKDNHKLNVQTEVLSGAKIVNLSKYLSNIGSIPKKVVINIGSNDVAQSKTPNHLMRPLWLTIEAAQKNFPQTEWFVNGILFRKDTRDKYIIEINESLKFMCWQLGITYLNTDTVCQDENYRPDGIHPNYKGATVLANLILEKANLKNVTTAEIKQGPSTTLDSIPVKTKSDLAGQDTPSHNKAETYTTTPTSPTLSNKQKPGHQDNPLNRPRPTNYTSEPANQSDTSP